jgi:hypothetical protein
VGPVEEHLEQRAQKLGQWAGANSIRLSCFSALFSFNVLAGTTLHRLTAAGRSRSASRIPHQNGLALGWHTHHGAEAVKRRSRAAIRGTRAVGYRPYRSSLPSGNLTLCWRVRRIFELFCRFGSGRAMFDAAPSTRLPGAQFPCLSSEQRAAIYRS